MSLSIHHRISIADGAKNRAEIALAALEARDPHAALGVSGRRLQKVIEDARAELRYLGDLAMVARHLWNGAA
ncbi:MAG: hypothetical protein J0I48_15050 [Devosia sp.]|uniref:hypothetical protein n=1 Tax=Devosia sp. 66-22 TaxID=1895753 RepID=UPI000929E3AA|nr:hypothetical protein [Devosia sp. 66-22]MBN9347490.1 hypothetical protein [Devosia sp.]OJX53646.1 MAG: hypothetical protein BGO81_13860 [Devosia sp. 66-22]